MWLVFNTAKITLNDTSNSSFMNKMESDVNRTKIEIDNC